MAATKDEREAFGRRLRELRTPLTIQGAIDRLQEERGTKLATAQLSAYERGEYAPRSRDVVMDLDLVLDGQGELLDLLGYPRDWAVEAQPGAWPVVGRYVMETRIQLECDSYDLADQAGLPQEVIVAIEEGEPVGGRAGVRQLWQISLALCQWPSTLERLAQGADPGAAKVSSDKFWQYLDEVEQGYEGRHQRHIDAVRERRSAVLESQIIRRLREIEDRLAALDGRTATADLEALTSIASDAERERRILGYTYEDAIRAMGSGIEDPSQFALAASGGLPEEMGPEQHRPSPEPEPDGP